jgi:molecular chaperone IbpA
MTKITSFDLTPFYRNTVGMDRLFDRITQQIDAAANAGNYPPYNIERVAENLYDIVIAVAGFGEHEVTVEVEANQLTVRGEKMPQDPAPEYLHRGLAFRDFERKFTLAEHIEVIKAEVKNGLLLIQLERVVPEEKKPRKIEITYQQ